MVTAASAQNSNKLQGKDFIFIAIFGLLLFVVFFAFAMVLGMNANTFWFTHGIGAIPAGIVWMYLVARVNKPGVIVIMSVIVAVVALLLGMLWTGPVGIVVGGVVGEIIMAGTKRSKAGAIAAFAAFTLCFWIGQESMILLAGSSYVDMVVASGMSREYGETLVNFMQSPVFLVALASSVVGPIIGGLLGSAVFKKYFAKIAA